MPRQVPITAPISAVMTPRGAAIRHLSACHPDRAEQLDLASALEDRVGT